jgi:hypothetical protein
VRQTLQLPMTYLLLGVAWVVLAGALNSWQQGVMAL